MRNIILFFAILVLSTACTAKPWCVQRNGDMSRLKDASEYKIRELKNAYLEDYIAKLRYNNNIEVSAEIATKISDTHPSRSSASKFYVAKLGVRAAYSGSFQGLSTIKVFKERDDVGNLYLNSVSMGSGEFTKNVPLLIEAPRSIDHVYTFCGSVN